LAKKLDSDRLKTKLGRLLLEDPKIIELIQDDNKAKLPS
jgi:hypothetical protein